MAREDVKVGELRKAIKVFNNTGLPAELAGGKVNAIGKTDAVIDAFVDAVNAVDDADRTDELPEAVIEMYNLIQSEGGEEEPEEEPEEEEPEEEEPEEEDEEEDEEEGETEKAEKAAKKAPKKSAKKKKADKEPKPKSRYGHTPGSQAAKIDDMLHKGVTLEEAAEELGTKKTRIQSHIVHLRKARGLTVEGKKDKKRGTVYKVVE